MDHDASAANFWELYGVAALVSWNQEPVNESSRKVYLLPLYRLVNTLPSLFLRSRYSLSFSVWCNAPVRYSRLRLVIHGQAKMFTWFLNSLVLSCGVPSARVAVR